VMTLQESYVKALLVNRAGLADAQADGDVLRGHELLLDAFNTDVRPLCARVRAGLGAAEEPLDELRRSAYVQTQAASRSAQNQSESTPLKG
jgi:L-rhamnose isomerase/sugar isomerase